MAILTLQGITKSYGVNTIFEDINLTINDGDTIGLIGQNGAGKTTLFKIVSGDISCDSGSVVIPKSITVGILEQMPETCGKTIYEYCLEAYTDVFKLIERREELENVISEHSGEITPSYERLLHEYSRVIFDIESKNIYSYESEIKGTLKGLGFKDCDLQKNTDTLSGGELSRLGLCRLLLTKPAVALLDEPTNHLDIDSMAWLEAYIKKSEAVFVIISHDRYFLDRTINRTVEIENRRIFQNNGNYTNFIGFKNSMIKSETVKYEKALAESERQMKIIRSMKERGTEKLANRALSREKALEKLVIPDKPFQSIPELKLLLGSKRQSGNDVVSVEGISKSFGDRLLFKDISFNVYKGDRIGIVGPNGVGKSTVLRILAGHLQADEGQFKLGTGVDVGYYDQNLTYICESNNLIEEVSHDFPDLDTGKIRALLGAFLFTGDDVFKTVSTLSGGERARIALLRLMLNRDNLLLLDEPTNHLDIYSREIVENSLLEFEGTIVAVSHDRYFLNKICNVIIHIENKGITVYHGNYDYYTEKYLQQKEMLISQNPAPAKTRTRVKADKKSERLQLKEHRKLKSEIEDVERSITHHEETIQAQEHLLCEESVYADFDKVKTLNASIREHKAVLEDLYKKWEELCL